jgi:hypothetical protein
MPLELTIPTPKAHPLEDAPMEPPTTLTRPPATECGHLSRAIELARELVCVLEDARPSSVGAAQHELTLANSLAAHVVDILSGLSPTSGRTSHASVDAE